MDTQKTLSFSFPLFFITLITGFLIVHASSHHDNHHRDNRSVVLTKLFVFGDSYADTGNIRKSASSWMAPYGITFPGKPSGRFSDGRILTDYIASYMKIKSPVPYIERNSSSKLLSNGMNFAYGGTGVFDTFYDGPNVTTQIDSFQKLLKDGVYTKHDLGTSVALFSVAGNDYATYTSNHGSAEGLPSFTQTVVNQIAVDLKRVHELGVKKVTITAYPPFGCFPDGIATTYHDCNETQNAISDFHNKLLQEAVEKLNNQTNDSPYIILDLDHAFMSAFTSQGDQGNLKFATALKPCCVGVNAESYCGSTDANGTKTYTVCKDPSSAFFWDDSHPTDEGWREVYSDLKPSLHQLYY